MKLLVTILYSYSNENTITSQVIDFDTHEAMERGIARIESTYKHLGSYKVECTIL